jgi:hypothetical protein
LRRDMEKVEGSWRWWELEAVWLKLERKPEWFV